MRGRKNLRKTMCAVFASMLLAAFGAVPTWADEEVPELPHVEGDAGIYDLVGYDFYEYNGKNYIILFSDYENTTSENVYASMQYITKLFQDGVQLQIGITDYGIFQEPLMEYQSSISELKPGGKICYKSEYELTSQSDIEFEVSEMMGDTLASCVIPYGGAVSEAEDESEPDYKTMYEELQKEYDALKAEYEKLLSEGNER